MYIDKFTDRREAASPSRIGQRGSDGHIEQWKVLFERNTVLMLSQPLFKRL